MLGSSELVLFMKEADFASLGLPRVAKMGAISASQVYQQLDRLEPNTDMGASTGPPVSVKQVVRSSPAS